MSNTLTPPRWKLILAFASIYIIWGSTYLTIAIAVDSIPAFLMAAFRFLIAGSVMFVWAKLSGVAFPTRLEVRSLVIIGGLLLLGGNGGVTWAEQQGLPSGLAALLVATVPLWVAVIEWLRPGGVQPSMRIIIGLVLGFVGLALLFIQPDSSGKVEFPALAAIVAAPILWSLGTVYSRIDRARLPDSPLMSTAVEMLAGGVLLAGMSFFTGEFSRLDPARVSQESLLSLVYLILFGSIVAFTAYVWLLKNSTPTRAATYAYVNPIVAILLGWAIRNEALTFQMLAATPMIILAVILITTGRARSKTRPMAAPAGPNQEGPKPIQLQSTVTAADGK